MKKTPLEIHRLEIHESYLKIKKVQDKCSHPVEMVVLKYESDTGNYDRSQDAYWIEYTCHYCGATWATRQGVRNKWTEECH